MRLKCHNLHAPPWGPELANATSLVLSSGGGRRQADDGTPYFYTKAIILEMAAISQFETIYTVISVVGLSYAWIFKRLLGEIDTCLVFAQS